MPLSVGTKLGPYEVVEPIGAGGMGEVWKARDTRLDRTVAIKVSKEKFSERFAREAKAIAALNHPHICQLYDVGPDYLVMEYVEGSPLKGPLAVEKAIEYAVQILSALDAAHRKGITHRDLKPGNILATKQGIKLLDFGLARIGEGSGDETVTMGVMGTPAYMAPEQWEGKPGDARSDIYAFGCVLYEMLTGKRAGKEGRPPVKWPSLEGVIATCMETDPEERWQSARDMRRMLALPTPPVPKQRPLWPWIAAVAALGALLSLVLWRERAPVAGDVVSFAIYPPENASFSEAANTTVNVPQFALSPDGHSIVFAAGPQGGRPRLWLRPMVQAGARALPETEDAQDPFWSPDSRWIGFFAEGKVKKISAAGGAVQVVAQTAAQTFSGATWGPDGAIVFAVGAIGPLQRVASSGGPVTPASILAPQEGTHRFPRFLPDGRHFLYVGLGSEQYGVFAGSLDDKNTKLLIRTNTSAAWAPPGYLLFVDGDRLLGQAFDAERVEISGQPFLIAEPVGRSSASLSAISASRTGTIAYAGTLAQNTRLTWFDRTGKPQGSTGSDYYSDFRLSPNEKLLAASLVNPKAGVVDIWMNDLARGSIARITGGALLSASAIWSPDGVRLAFRTLRGGLFEFHQKSPAGGGDEATLLSAETERAAQIPGVGVAPTDWSPDGQNIAFSVPTLASGYDLWVLPLTGDRKPFKFLATPAEEMHGNFSPDGHLMAYTSNATGKFEVYAATFPQPDRIWPISTGGGYEPRWRADGREIYYLSEDRKLMAVSVGPGPSFGVPHTLFQTRVPAGVHVLRTHYVPSRDGQRFLVNTQNGEPSPMPITVVLNWTAGLKK